jgi:hypothetical protein
VAEEQPELERVLELTVELKLQLKLVVGSFILKLKLKLAVVEEQPGLELTVELKLELKRVVGRFIIAYRMRWCSDVQFCHERCSHWGRQHQSRWWKHAAAKPFKRRTSVRNSAAESSPSTAGSKVGARTGPS